MADLPHNSTVHWDLDSAWSPGPLGLRTIDVRKWGPRLRYHGNEMLVAEFAGAVSAADGDTAFALLGSGDFHHLAGLRIRQLSPANRQIVIVSFDNHPDWDIRPPAWSCGGWLSRAVRLPTVAQAHVWGCGNFELRWPARLFADRAAVRDGRLHIHAWAERQSPAVGRRWNCLNRENWRARFETFAQSVAGRCVYVTVDLDCLALGESVTNWEPGLFTADDVGWALAQLRQRARIIGGDLCGAYSTGEYARPFQRFAARWDHPKLPRIDADEARRINEQALRKIWPALTGN